MNNEIPGGFSVKDFVAEPRRDLCEPAFRKYERVIARGIMESFVINPRTVGERLSARTFVARFNDAKRGYTMYGYRSEYIPKNYNVAFVKAVVGKNEMVLIYNVFGQTKESIMAEIAMPEPEKVDASLLRKVATALVAGHDPEPVPVHMDDEGAVKQVVDMLRENPAFFQGDVPEWICMNPVQYQAARELKVEFPFSSIKKEYKE